MKIRKLLFRVLIRVSLYTQRAVIGKIYTRIIEKYFGSFEINQRIFFTITDFTDVLSLIKKLMIILSLNSIAQLVWLLMKKPKFVHGRVRYLGAQLVREVVKSNQLLEADSVAQAELVITQILIIVDGSLPATILVKILLFDTYVSIFK